MRAIRVHQVGPPSVLKLETNVPVPPFGEKQVLVRVKAVGVNGVEALIRSGAFGPKATYTPGTDAAGIVEKAGNEVKNVKVGDRVFVGFGLSDGAYAEFMAVDALRVFPLPENVTFEQGAALGVPYFTAHRALVTKARVKAGQTVLIHGASGGVGVAALQIAKDLGAKVLGTASTAEGIKLIESYGTAFNHRTEHYDQEIAKQFPQIDVILEMLADVNIPKDLNLIGRMGTIIVIGCKGLSNGAAFMNMMTKECKIDGVSLFLMNEVETIEAGKYIAEGLKRGCMKPVVGKTLPLADVAKAHEEVVSSSKNPGKIVLTI